MCDADTTGKMPQCEVCGECYPQWKEALETLSRNISVEVPRAYNLSLTPQQPGMFNWRITFLAFVRTHPNLVFLWHKGRNFRAITSDCLFSVPINFIRGISAGKLDSFDSILFP